MIWHLLSPSPRAAGTPRLGLTVSAVHLADVYGHWSVATGVLVCLLITWRGLLLLKKNVYFSHQKSRHIGLAGSVTALAILLGCGIV
jgi:hypothetical protein